jgi:hypothetical protein
MIALFEVDFTSIINFSYIYIYIYIYIVGQELAHKNLFIEAL